MDSFDIEFKGLNELMEDFKKAEEKVPYLGEKVLKKGMNKCKKLSKEKTPISKHGKKHLKDSYKVLKVEYTRDGMNIKMTNKSPHFHLVEKGHRIVSPYTGEEKGFVPGAYMVKRSMAEMETIFPKQVERMVKKILK